MTIAREKIWSENTSRSASGLMVGDIIGIKIKLEIKWNFLTQEEQKTLIDALEAKTFFAVEYVDDRTGLNVTKSMYAGTFSSSPYSYVKKGYTGASVSLVER